MSVWLITFWVIYKFLLLSLCHSMRNFHLLDAESMFEMSFYLFCFLLTWVIVSLQIIAGSDNGTLRLYDIQHFPTTNRGVYQNRGSVIFDEFDQLTSVHVNSTDEKFLASGYSKNVALYDISSGRRLQVFTDMHREHINVVKFSNHSPSLFATSSFDQDVKMWDIRQNATQPCYTASSSRGNVMVCFSPDDHYLLVSAVDNEVIFTVVSYNALPDSTSGNTMLNFLGRF